MQTVLSAGLSLITVIAMPIVAQAQSPYELFIQGAAYYGAGNYVQAEETLQQALQADVDGNHTFAIYHYLANALREQGRYEEAEVAYQAALNDNSDGDTHFYTDFGINLAAQERHEEAEAAFRQALSLEAPLTAGLSYPALSTDGAYALAHLHLGTALYNQGRYPEAELAYRDSIRLNPEDVRSYIYLGSVLFHQDQEAEAEATFQAVRNSYPDNARIYIILGDIYQFHGYVEEAIAHYQQALSLDPQNAEAQDKLTEAESLQLQPGSIE
ncbi:MAG: tetratricopeptide repeat protein [Cyanobacteria bacterium J06626_18]